MSLVIDEHRQYLADHTRLAAFERAIAATIKAGDIVVDLGAGTGILGLLACRAGAARVYSLESESIAGLTRELAVANGYHDRVTVVRDLSTRVRLPELADVVVTDQVGAFGFDAGFLEFAADAYARLLRPGGRTIPSSVHLEICPCEAPQISEAIAFWRTRPAGFDFSPVHPMALSTGYRSHLDGGAMLATPAVAATLDPAGGSDPRFHVSLEFIIAREGTADAIAGWFRADLGGGVELSNGPVAVARINRRHVVFPFEHAVPVNKGDRVVVTMRIWPADIFVAWEVVVHRRGQAQPLRVAKQSTFGGMLLAREDLTHTRNDARPRLTASGRARLTILELADGAHSVESIEHAVRQRHPDLLLTPEAAAVFVAEVLTRYAE